MLQPQLTYIDLLIDYNAINIFSEYSIYFVLWKYFTLARFFSLFFGFVTKCFTNLGIKGKNRKIRNKCSTLFLYFNITFVFKDKKYIVCETIYIVITRYFSFLASLLHLWKTYNVLQHFGVYRHHIKIMFVVKFPSKNITIFSLRQKYCLFFKFCEFMSVCHCTVYSC